MCLGSVVCGDELSGEEANAEARTAHPDRISRPYPAVSSSQSNTGPRCTKETKVNSFTNALLFSFSTHSQHAA